MFFPNYNIKKTYSQITLRPFYHPHPRLFLTSYARRRTEAGFTGSGGRLSFVQEGAGVVRSPEARGSVPPGLQNQHRPRGAASLQGLLLQGTGNMEI